MTPNIWLSQQLQKNHLIKCCILSQWKASETLRYPNFFFSLNCVYLSIYLFSVWVCVFTHARVYVCVQNTVSQYRRGGQETTCRGLFFTSTLGFGDPPSGHQSWQQAPYALSQLTSLFVIYFFNLIIKIENKSIASPVLVENRILFDVRSHHVGGTRYLW